MYGFEQLTPRIFFLFLLRVCLVRLSPRNICPVFLRHGFEWIGGETRECWTAEPT